MLHDHPTLDRTAASEDFRRDIVNGLRKTPKQIPSKYFYDQRGSELFEQICELDEYYLTRTETQIMRDHAGEMGAAIGHQARLIELGSGSSVKTRILLDHLPDLVNYTAVDISGEHLKETAKQLGREYPDVEIVPVEADFTQPFVLPQAIRPYQRTVTYFPGSTIGNFEAAAAHRLLQDIASRAWRDDGLLIGIDLQKDTHVLERAYDDAAGITAEFNFNLLRRMQKELDATIDLKAFDYLSFYNSQHGRIESYLRSEKHQTIQLDDLVFEFAAGELLHTEYAHKYTIEGFAKLAGTVGWTLQQQWTDPRDYFAVLYFRKV